MKRAMVASWILALVLAPNLWADTLVPVNGSEVTGKVTLTKDGYVVELSNGGTVTYAVADVLSVTFEPSATLEYNKLLAAVPEGDAEAWYALAQWCGRQGMDKELEAALNRVLAIQPDHELARKSMGYENFKGQWMTYDEVMAAKGFVEYEGQWLTPSEKAWLQEQKTQQLQNEELSRLARAADAGDPQNLQRISELLAGASAEDRAAVVALGLKSEDARFREFAVRELAADKNETSFNRLVDVALLDERRSVRMAATESVQRLTEGTNVSAEQPFIAALKDERAAVRIAAADALAMVGSSGALETLIANYRMTWGQGSRNHIAVVKQHAYVEDYDVQVATAAAVADPVIGVVQEGLVLDARPLRTERVITVLERRVLREAIAKIGGESAVPTDVPTEEGAGE